jgi:hypothetical protein
MEFSPDAGFDLADVILCVQKFKDIASQPDKVIRVQRVQHNCKAYQGCHVTEDL